MCGQRVTSSVTLSDCAVGSDHTSVLLEFSTCHCIYFSTFFSKYRYSTYCVPFFFFFGYNEFPTYNTSHRGVYVEMISIFRKILMVFRIAIKKSRSSPDVLLILLILLILQILCSSPFPYLYTSESSEGIVILIFCKRKIVSEYCTYDCNSMTANL